MTRRLSGVQPRRRLTCKIPDPDVTLLVTNVECDARAVGGDPRDRVRARRRLDWLLVSFAIDPHELPGRCLRARAARHVHKRTILRHGEIRSPAWYNRHTFDNRDRIAQHLESCQIESHGAQRAGGRVHQISLP